MTDYKPLKFKDSRYSDIITYVYKGKSEIGIISKNVYSRGYTLDVPGRINEAQCSTKEHAKNVAYYHLVLQDKKETRAVKTSKFYPLKFKRDARHNGEFITYLVYFNGECVGHIQKKPNGYYSAEYGNLRAHSVKRLATIKEYVYHGLDLEFDFNRTAVV